MNLRSAPHAVMSPYCDCPTLAGGRAPTKHPSVTGNHREVIKTRGESYSGKNVSIFRIVASLDPCKLLQIKRN